MELNIPATVYKELCEKATKTGMNVHAYIRMILATHVA